MKIYFDTEAFKEKPGKAAVRDINIRLSDTYFENLYDWEIHDVVYMIDRGHTFVPVELTAASRKKENWSAQQLFLLDFDDFNIEDCKKISQEFDIYPTFGYYTFSHTQRKSKFRLAFMFAHKIDNMKVRYFIMQSLYKVFDKKADSQCVSDAVRLFYAGQGLFNSKYEDFSIDEIDAQELPVLDFDMFTKIEKIIHDRSPGHYKRNIERFYGGTDIRLDASKNIYPPSAFVQLFHEGDELDGFKKHLNKMVVEAGSIDHIHPVYHKVCSTPPQNYRCSVHQNVKVGNMRVQHKTIGNAGTANRPLSTKTGAGYWTLVFETGKQKKTVKTPFNMSNHKLVSKSDCELLTQALQHGYNLTNGHQLDFQKRMHLATNLRHIKGGLNLLKQMVEKLGHPEHGTEYIKEQVKGQIRSMKYPTNCSQERCPFFNQCQRKGKNIVHQIAKTSIPPIKIGKQEYQDIKKSEMELSEAIKLPGRVLISGETALGKTKLYIEEIIKSAKQLNERSLIVVPTHKLGDELLKRIDYDDVGKLDSLHSMLSDAGQAIYSRLLKLGFGSDITKKLYSRLSFEDQKVIESYSSYFSDILKKQIVIVTHSRFLLSQRELFKNFKNVYIDEDIMNELIRTESVKIQDLHRLRSLVENEPSLRDKIDMVLERISQFPDSINLTEFNLPSQSLLKYVVDMNEIINTISSNVFEWVDAERLHINKQKQECYFLKKVDVDFPENFKIMSASASADFWKKLVPDLEVIAINKAKHKGDFLQIANHSYSREFLRKNLNKLPELFPDVLRYEMKVITYKEFVENFTSAGFDVIGHFGAIDGLDEFKGQHIAIIGTPRLHPIKVKTMADAFGFQYVDEDLKRLQRHIINKNGYRFPFYTYDHEDLREIQHWLIESELIQCVGRARTLRVECNVVVFSDFMLPIEKVIA